MIGPGVAASVVVGGAASVAAVLLYHRFVVLPRLRAAWRRIDAEDCD